LGRRSGRDLAWGGAWRAAQLAAGAGEVLAGVGARRRVQAAGGQAWGGEGRLLGAEHAGAGMGCCAGRCACWLGMRLGEGERRGMRHGGLGEAAVCLLVLLFCLCAWAPVYVTVC